MTGINLRTLGLALVAAFAMSATAAAAASAEPFAFHSEVIHTDLTGSGEGTSSFGFDAGTAVCNTAKFEGTMSTEETTELALTPAFESCTVEPLGLAPVTMNGCQLVLTASTKEGSAYKAGLDIACPGTNSITVVAKVAGITKCTISIPAQSLSGVTVSEVSEGDIKAVASVEGVKYSQAAGVGAGACAKAENTTNGTFKGDFVIGGSLEGVEVPLLLQPPPQVIAADVSATFGGIKTQKSITITNVYIKKIEIKNFIFSTTYFKKVKDNCGGELDLKQSCSIELQCENLLPKGSRAFLNTETKDPQAFASTELKGCVTT